MKVRLLAARVLLWVKQLLLVHLLVSLFNRAIRIVWFKTNHCKRVLFSRYFENGKYHYYIIAGEQYNSVLTLHIKNTESFKLIQIAVHVTQVLIVYFAL